MAKKKDAQSQLNLTQEQIDRWRVSRWRARTDLLYLCNFILNYPDVSKTVHGSLIDTLQKFPKPTWEQMKACDVYRNGLWHYTPLVPLYDLPADGRRVLILDSRSFLKTTINAISHTIQWLLNYPDISIMVISSAAEKADLIVGEMRQHFAGNPVFRQMFPEHCPASSVSEWGTKNQFITEARNQATIRKESSVMAGAIEKAAAGLHFDIMKFSDIVEPNNVKTDSQISGVIQSFGMFENLLVRPNSWIDVEGTRYDFSDLYGKIIEGEELLAKENRKSVYKIYVRGCYKKQLPKGQTEYKFIPEELYYPDIKDESGLPVSWWPEKWPTEQLEAKRKNPALGDFAEILFATQNRNNPMDISDEKLVPFSLKKFTTISRENFRNNIRVVYRSTTVDTADTVAGKSKFSAITTVAWDQYGRGYVDDIRHGRFMPDQIIDEILDVQEKYKPIRVLVEDYAFTRGLFPAAMREIQSGKVNPKTSKPYPYVNFKFIKRDNDISKQTRILNTLQPWYNSGDLRFLEDLGPMEALKHELSRFPRYSYTDIIDTLSDQFQERQWFGRESVRPTFEEHQNKEMQRFLKIEDPYKEDYSIPQPSQSRTGY